MEPALAEVTVCGLRSIKIPVQSLPKGEKQDLWLELQQVAEVSGPTQTLDRSYMTLQCETFLRIMACHHD